MSPETLYGRWVTLLTRPGMLSVTRVDRALQTAHMGQAVQVSHAARKETSQDESTLKEEIPFASKQVWRASVAG